MEVTEKVAANQRPLKKAKMGGQIEDAGLFLGGAAKRGGTPNGRRDAVISKPPKEGPWSHREARRKRNTLLFLLSRLNRGET